MSRLKITYLLGAGASAQRLPLVSNLPRTLSDTITWLEGARELHFSNAEYFDEIKREYGTKYQLQTEMINSLKWLRDHADIHSSIDTFAKKLFLKNTEETKEELKKLKGALTVFFILEQLRHPTADMRYDTFFASITERENRSVRLPSHIKILSWNYDFQLEKAFSHYSNLSSLDDIQYKLNVSHTQTNKNTINQFSVYKLNGTTGVMNTSSRDFENPLDKINSTIDKKVMEQLVKAYWGITGKGALKSLLRFAWEYSPEDAPLTGNAPVEIAQSETSNTDILVVIGYSFPFFNREIDRKIIGPMKNLKKVYFQAPDKGADEMRQAFRSIRPEIGDVMVEYVRHANQFFLPFEL